MRILDILKARKLGYQTLHNTTDMLLAKKVSGGSYEDVTVSGNPISITGAKGGLAKALTVDMLPIQDLHGYDSPWVGGGGKNKLQNTGSTQTINDVKFTVNSDGTVLVNGTASASTVFVVHGYQKLSDYGLVDGTQYTLSGTPAESISNNAYVMLGVQGSGTEWRDTTGSGNSFTPTSTDLEKNYRVVIMVASGTTVNNLVYKPMLRKATESSEFAPYSNICPISGRTQTEIKRCGKNLCKQVLDNALSLSGTTRVVVYGTGTTAVMECLKGVTYTVSGATGRNRAIVGYFDSMPDYQTDISVYDNSTEQNGQITSITTSGYTFTAQYTGYALLYLANAVLSNVNIQIEVGSTATDYEAYVPEANTTIQFGQTVYGGTCDIVNGGTSSIMAIVDLDNLNWSLISRDRWTAPDLRNVIKKVESNNKKANIIAEQYETYTTDQLHSDTSLIGIESDIQGSIKVRNGSTTEKPHGKICYELATPTTINTPATTISLNKGNNTLSTSGDNMSVTYEGKPIPQTLSMMSPNLTSTPEQVEEPEELNTEEENNYVENNLI